MVVFISRSSLSSLSTPSTPSTLIPPVFSISLIIKAEKRVIISKKVNR